MTPLQGRAPLKRETAVWTKDGGKPRQLIVTLHPEFMELRLKGRRSMEVVTYEAAYHWAIKARVFAAKMDRAKLKAAKKRAK